MTREQHIQTWRERSRQTGTLDSIGWKLWRDTVLYWKPGRAHSEPDWLKDAGYYESEKVA